MKQKKLKKSLVLNKSTIADLDSGDMYHVLGRGETEDPEVCPTIVGQTCHTRCGTDCWCSWRPTECIC
jgi:hypothetical protein